MNINLYKVVRLAVSIGLVFEVWLNAHWSVALLLSLATVRIEPEDHRAKLQRMRIQNWQISPAESVDSAGHHSKV